MRQLPPSREAYATGWQPSMSWSWLLLKCSYPFAPDGDVDVTTGDDAVDDRVAPGVQVGEAARYGSAFHELEAATFDLSKARVARALSPRGVGLVARKWKVDPTGLIEHVRSARAELDRWLARNEYRIDFTRLASSPLIEKALALEPLNGARFIDGHDESHRYHGLRFGEQPGTLDFALIARILKGKYLVPAKGVPLLVLDWKTGEAEDFSRPLEKPQLLSLGAAMMRATGTDEAIIGAIHARRRSGMTKVYSERVKLHELASHEDGIAKALSRIGDGSMRPGPWCQRCPAREGCPARDSNLLSRAGEVLNGLTAAGGALSSKGLSANDVAIVKAPSAAMSAEKKLGLLYSVIRKGEAMAARAREELKATILASRGTLLPETPDGEYLVVREYEKETLSKSSVIEAYGKTAGTRVLEKLRKDGAINTTKVVQLWPEKERIGRHG